MTGPTPFFGVSNWPGARAATSVVEVAPGTLGLSIYLDPIDWVLNIPPFPGGEQYMVRFLRQLAHTAGELADRLDAARVDGDLARHAVSDSAWSGGGDQDG